MKLEVSEATRNITQKIGLNEQETALRKAFLNFNKQDIELLESIHASLEPAREAFAAQFYEHLLSFPQLHSLLKDAATIERLKKTQAKYFSELTAGNYGDEYVMERLRVGVVHQRIGLEPKWYMGAYSVYLSGLLPIVWESCEGSRDKLIPTLSALLKIILFDMSLALDTYFHADKQALREARDYAEKIIRCMPSGLLVVNTDFEIISANRALRQMCHIPNNAPLEGLPLGQVLSSGILLSTCESVLQNGRHAHEVEIQFSHGSDIYYFEANISATLLGDVPMLLILLQDISAHKLYEEKLAHQATHDALTHLPNRNLLKDRLDQALAYADRSGLIVAVLFLDLDRFKNINDSLGHEAGDKLINAVSERLVDSVREGDTVARIGGDEFVMLLPDITCEEDAVHIANKILGAVAMPTKLNEQELFPSASIGISLYPKDGKNGPTLLKHADTAMYLAKEAGRGTFRFFTQEMNTRAVNRLTLEAKLRHALAHNEFTLHYQPLYDAASGKIVCAEALIRWLAPEGLVPPDAFIPIAEETGLIIPIGEWVLHTACAQAAEWTENGLPSIRIAINLSAHQFRQQQFAALIRQFLQDRDFDPCRLELEITESVIMESAEQSIDMLNALHGLGIRLVVDDFGTGYSSLAYLKRFPISTLKIDRSFVSDIPADTDDAAIVSAVIALAHNLKLDVVAEGVEDLAQVDFLRDRGCDYLQGFHFSKPLPAEDFANLLRLHAA